MSQRAPAMAPEARRAAILEATLPLLLERGAAISTRQIAEAAGIAEGTIFRVFPDKDAVVRAAIELAIDPEPAERAIAAIDASLPFEEQLAEAVRIMQRRLADIWRLVTAVGDDHAPPKAPPAEFPALAALFEREPLRHDPEQAARELRALTLAVSHPMLYGPEPMPAPEVVSLLLDGIRIAR